jgi:hypothetical protein
MPWPEAGSKRSSRSQAAFPTRGRLRVLVAELASAPPPEGVVGRLLPSERKPQDIAQQLLLGETYNSPTSNLTSEPRPHRVGCVNPSGLA